MPFWTYIMASAPAGTIYTGSTDHLGRRMIAHREKLLKGFTARYGVHRLVWFEEHDTRHEAFVRERRIKEWRRRWKVELIERFNPHWDDLIPELELGDNAETFLRKLEERFPVERKPGAVGEPSTTSAHPGERRDPY